jgi:signal transduction histidine kinase
MAASRGWQRLGSPTALWRLDAAAALVITIAAAVAAWSVPSQAPRVLVVVVAAVSASTVAWRRATPFLATLVAVVALATYQRLTAEAITELQPFAVVLCAYVASTVAIERRQMARLAGLVALTAAAVVLMASNSPVFDVATVVTAALPVIVAPMVAGWIVVRHRNLTHRLGLTRALLEDEQELRVARAAADERVRMARELHDVVGHTVSVMVIQAGVARLTMIDDRVAAEKALRRIVSVGEDALTDLRRLVESQRLADGEADDEAAALIRLASLARDVSDAGIPTRLTIEGATEALTEEVGQVVYRLVQEALTNALKHVAGGHAAVTVHVGERVDVRVVSGRDDLTRASRPVLGGGHGLIGMAERVAQHGGTLEVGTPPTGEFEVHASVPLAPASAETASRPMSRWARVRAAAHPWHDAIFAATAFVCLEADALASAGRRGPLAVNLLLVGGMATVTLWRRSFPLAICIAINALAVPLSGGLADITQATLVSTFVFVVPVYSVATWARARAAAVGLMVTLATTVGVGVWQQVATAVILDNVGLTIAVWAVGRLVRAQRNLAGDLERTSCELRAERSQRERDASSVERNRIVRRLEVSVMKRVEALVTAAAALLARPHDEWDAAGDIRAIEDGGRVALGEMRSIVGALRSRSADVDAPMLAEAGAG